MNGREILASVLWCATTGAVIGILASFKRSPTDHAPFDLHVSVKMALAGAAAGALAGTVTTLAHRGSHSRRIRALVGIGAYLGAAAVFGAVIAAQKGQPILSGALFAMQGALAPAILVGIAIPIAALISRIRRGF